MLLGIKLYISEQMCLIVKLFILTIEIFKLVSKIEKKNQEVAHSTVHFHFNIHINIHFKTTICVTGDSG